MTPIALLATALAASASAKAGEPPQAVVLVTIDTLRADHLACYGYQRVTSPFLDGLAARGILFEKAFSSSSHTAPSHATLFTGLNPSQHGLLTNSQALPGGSAVDTLAETFAAAGYDTAAFCAVGFLKPVTRGFAKVDCHASGDFELYRQAPDTASRVLEWLKTKTPADRFFLWIHFYDPHHPYHPPADLVARTTLSSPETQEDFARYAVDALGVRPGFYMNAAALARTYSLYDAEILLADRELGRIHEQMEKSGLNARALWIVTADHGEGLGSHGIAGHGEHVYNEQVHVPLLFSAANLAKGARIGSLVRHVDLFPTLVDLARLRTSPQSARSQGRSLRPLLEGGSLPATLAFSQRRPKDATQFRRSWEEGDVYCLQDLDLKYIVHSGGNDEVFDLREDPLELKNLFAARSPRAGEMGRAARALFERMRREMPSSPSPLDPSVRDELPGPGQVQ